MNKFFTITLVIAAGIFSFFLLVLPQFNEFSSARSVLAERELLLEDTQAAEANIGRLQQEYQQQEALIRNVLFALPDQERYDAITESLQAAAQASGMQIRSFGLGEAKKGKNKYGVIDIKLELNGTYSDLVTFLDALERSLRLYDVASIEVAQGGDASNSGILNISLQVHSYSLQ